ncbi:MAG TPA: ribonuclease H-like domain-containing protein [Candidatus Dormibacteraeota bacterium]|nr:ribonuclease H-like domain-containing protein [Candidatus Dormibacteraeota bacterium]
MSSVVGSRVSLRERLDRLGGQPRRAPQPKPTIDIPRGFEPVDTPYGVALLRQDVVSLKPLEPDPGVVAYLDTETTGLSGGSGTLIFAAAVARPIADGEPSATGSSAGGLRLAQFFLPQPGMEPAFLYALNDELQAASAIASFNGGSFDLPILRTRWVMARMGGELAHPGHLDLLTLVRALYRHRMESCTLRTVEERLLGYEREDPIGGAFAPDAYFAYMRTGSSTMLELILEHNRLDVISLVYLHSLLLKRLQGMDADMDASDWLALGRHRFRRGARADGWRALRNAAGFRDGDAAATAGLWISRRLVRRRAIDSADRLLEDMEERFGGDVRVSVARARLLEWRRRDPTRALSVVEAAQRRVPEAAPQLEARRERLTKKVGRLGGSRDGLRDRRQRNRGEGWLQGSLGYGAAQGVDDGRVEFRA